MDVSLVIVARVGLLLWKSRENELRQCLVYAIQNRLLCQRTMGGQREGPLGLLEGGWKDEEFMGNGEKNISASASRRRLVAENKREPCAFQWMPTRNQLSLSLML